MDDLSTAWDRHATTYRNLFAPLTNYIGRCMVTMVEPRLVPGARVLDIACGPGAVALPCVERALGHRAAGAAPGVVVATDISPAMLAVARDGAARLGADEAIFRGEVQNGEALTLADAAFDLVFSCFGIFLFGDRRAGWREASRVLRPGGTFVTSVWQGPQGNQMLREQLAPLVKALPQHLLPKQGGGWMEVATADALVAEVSASGQFTDVHVATVHASIAISDREAAWGSLCENPVMGALLAKCTPAELEAVHAAYVEHLGALAGGAGRSVVLESVCNVLVATRA